jgi:hypothetical protein
LGAGEVAEVEEVFDGGDPAAGFVSEPDGERRGAFGDGFDAEGGEE